MQLGLDRDRLMPQRIVQNVLGITGAAPAARRDAKFFAQILQRTRPLCDAFADLMIGYAVTKTDIHALAVRCRNVFVTVCPLSSGKLTIA